MDCCASSWDRIFTRRYSRTLRRSYERHGLTGPARRVVELISARGVTGATVLEIGGGIGELHVELLLQGAASATSLELSSAYEADADILLTRHGLNDRVTRRCLDLATDPQGVEPADIVVLNRVVCCYPDFSSLLTAAAGRARRLLVFTHPPRSLFWRAAVAFGNWRCRLLGQEYRAHLHSPTEMIRVVEGAGFRHAVERRGVAWWIQALEPA